MIKPFIIIKKYIIKKKKDEKNKNPGMIAGIMNNMGLIYSELGNNIKAKKYYQKSLDLRERSITKYFIF